MEKVAAVHFLSIHSTIATHAGWMGAASKALSTANHDASVKQRLRDLFTNIERSNAMATWMPDAYANAMRLKRQFEMPGGGFNYESWALLLDGLNAQMRADAEKLTLVRVTRPESYEVERPLGDAVYEAFPSARFDVTEAFTCLACDRYNATIYHVTLAGEVGLRVLARDRGITSVAKNKYPLDHAQWGLILGELETALREIKTSWGKGNVQDAAEKFYGFAVREAREINDIWRRHIDHARGFQYTYVDATAAIGHVGLFLDRLAKLLKEGRRPTSTTWKRVPKGL